MKLFWKETVVRVIQHCEYASKKPPNCTLCDDLNGKFYIMDFFFNFHKKDS